MQELIQQNGQNWKVFVRNTRVNWSGNESNWSGDKSNWSGNESNWSGNKASVQGDTDSAYNWSGTETSVHLLHPPRMAKKGLLGSPRALPK